MICKSSGVECTLGCGEDGSPFSPCQGTPWAGYLSGTPVEPVQGKVEDGGGLRFNEGKRDYTLIPDDALAYLADLFTLGARKYAPRNWERGMKYTNVMKSLDRHWAAFKSGEDRDPESTLYHMVHVVWNAMALLTYQLRGIGEDDRYKVPLPPVPDYNAMTPGASNKAAQ